MEECIAVDLDGFLTSFGPTGRFKAPKVCYFLFFLFFSPRPNEDNLIKVRKLKEAGYRIIILSARPEITRKLTEKWLERQNLEVDEIILVGPGEVKDKKLSVLLKRGIDYYFGDSIVTVRYLKRKGIITYKG